MRLSQASRSATLEPPLPQPYPALAHRALFFRRGQSSLTVAAPGVGKSVAWLNFALRMRVPTLYFSGDTDRHDVTVRTVAAASTYECRQVDRWMTDGLATFDSAKWLRAADHISFVFDAELTADLVTERLKAFAEVHGEYPALVVIDNLSNTVESEADEYAELRQVAKVMQRVARTTDSHVALLHHATGAYEDGEKPIPQSGAIGKLAKVPELVLTLHRAGDGKLGVVVAKNRSGPADPSGRSFVVLPIDYTRSALLGFEEAA